MPPPSPPSEDAQLYMVMTIVIMAITVRTIIVRTTMAMANVVIMDEIQELYSFYNYYEEEEEDTILCIKHASMFLDRR